MWLNEYGINMNYTLSTHCLIAATVGWSLGSDVLDKQG